MHRPIYRIIWINADRQLFENIMNVLEGLKEQNIFKLGRRYFTTSMYDAIMLSLSEENVKLSEINIDELGKKITELKKKEEFTRYVGSASSNPTSITNKVKIAKQILLEISGS